MEIKINRRRGIRRLTVRVGRGGKVTVSAPPRLSVAFIERFVQEKSDWIQNAIAQIQKKEAAQPPKTKFPNFESSKSRAKKLLLERARYWSEQYGVKFNRVSIKRAATRWGSCSSQGNLNFHYKLLYLPEELREYVVVHEICHLIEMNHSRAFWAEVNRGAPQWRTCKKRLKEFVI